MLLRFLALRGHIQPELQPQQALADHSERVYAISRVGFNAAQQKLDQAVNRVNQGTGGGWRENPAPARPGANAFR